MRILVTGGAGFIGSQVADGYINLGHEVIIIDNLSSGKENFVNPNAKFYKVDIRDKDKVEEIFKKEKPEVLNHHAAQISVRESVADPINDAQINIIGFLNILEAGRKNGLKKVIFASSGGVVYGDTDLLPTPETYMPLRPQSPYGIAKLSSEYYLNYFYQSFKIPYVALRYANIYGPRQNPHGEAGVVAIFALKLLKGETPVINGDGLQTRDYVYVGDIVEANRKALVTDKTGAFNIGTSKETNVVEIFDNIKSLIGVKNDAVHGPAKFGEQKRSCLDATLAQKILGWNAKVDLKEGLKKTVEYFQNLKI